MKLHPDTFGSIWARCGRSFTGKNQEPSDAYLAHLPDCPICFPPLPKGWQLLDAWVRPEDETPAARQSRKLVRE